MKKGICLIERLYVPYGQTVHVESLRVDKLIVDGSLIVEGKISAVICRGKGSAQVDVYKRQFYNRTVFWPV